jgi:hypothetical protein
MLKLLKDNALTRQQLSKKAIKKIPLYENKGDRSVKVPFFDVASNKTRYLVFYNLSGYSGNAEWTYVEVVD